ncbi:uncharacterized protein CFAP97D2-like [Erpetoichthys calabaricus]|nr:uncharacterized protein CFAP97D2-like [Erpetoichthys calabaricus]
MHRSYQPLEPVTSKYLQKRMDDNKYQQHRRKVNDAKPVVDTKGHKTPGHLQLNLKKLQMEEDRLSTISTDNKKLALKLADILRSKGQVDNWNDPPARSMNAQKRRMELLNVCHENQAILERINKRESDYRRELWEEDWQNTERILQDIARYPHGVPLQQKKGPTKILNEKLEKVEEAEEVESQHD